MGPQPFDPNTGQPAPTSTGRSAQQFDPRARQLYFQQTGQWPELAPNFSSEMMQWATTQTGTQGGFNLATPAPTPGSEVPTNQGFDFTPGAELQYA